MLGVALGEIGLSMGDFDALSLPEFSSIMTHHRDAEERKYRYSWEQTRFLSMMALQPYSKRNLREKDICTFPWEKTGKNEVDVKAMRQRAHEVLNSQPTKRDVFF